MNPLYKLLLSAIVALAGLGALLPGSWRTEGERGEMRGKVAELTLFCAASVRAPVEEIAARYERERGVRIHIEYGGSNTLLSQLEVGRRGDLYLPADDSYLQVARERNLIDEVTPLAQMTAVVGVAHGNRKQVASLDDLLQLRVAMGNPDQTAIGRATRDLLETSGRWEDFDAQVRAAGVYKPTVGDVANDVMIGSVDAGVLWDAVASQFPEIDTVELPEFTGSRSAIAVGVLRGADRPQLARAFANFLAASDGGLPVFEKLGYSAASGKSLSATTRERTDAR